MTLRKRIRQMWAAASQEWHQQTCSECGSTWMAVGKERPELIRICDACEVENLSRFMVFAELEYRRMSNKGVM